MSVSVDFISTLCLYLSSIMWFINQIKIRSEGMIGQRLKLARKKAGLSMQALSMQMSPKVSAQAISKYESDKMLPSSSVLIGLGKALGVSLDFLMGGQVQELKGIEFRKHSSTSAQDKAKAEALVIEKLENYLAIEEIVGVAAPKNPFEKLITSQLESYDEVDKIARNLRKEWKLGIDPIASMTKLLEDKGIKVIEASLPERFDGLTCEVHRGRDKPETDVIVVSDRTNIERKRFTLAHELAHRIILSTGDPKIHLEKAMNRFAGAFLVPHEHLINEVGASRHGMTYHELIRLKRLYGVSAAAMLMRLGQVGVLSAAAIDYAFRTYAKPWRKSEPEPIQDDEGFAAFEKPQRYKNLVWRALGEELISPVRAAQLLNLPLASVEREIRGPRQP